MAGVTLTRQDYLGWRAWRIRRDPVELVLVPDVGGRCMQLTWRGRELFFTQPEYRGATVQLEGDVHAQKRALGFRVWGGEKTWLAPQSRWTDGVPFLDLDSGPYTLDVLADTSDVVSVRLTSPICRETGLQLVRTFTVRAQTAAFDVEHELVNPSPHPVDWGLWSVSQLLRAARVFLPRRPDSPNPDGVKTYPEEGQSTAARGEVVQLLGSLAAIDCRTPVEFKFGVDGPEGWLLAVWEGGAAERLGYLTRFPVVAGAPYAQGCPIEVYNSARYPYLEVEVHSPLLRVPPGGRGAFRETRRMVPVAAELAGEAAVRALLADSAPSR